MGLSDVFFIGRDIDEIINHFWTQTEDAGEFKSGLCAEFAIALGRLFDVKYWEIYTESYMGIHYFVEYENAFYDVNGSHYSQDQVIDNNQYYSQDFDDEEVKVKEVSATAIHIQDESTIEYLIERFLEE